MKEVPLPTGVYQHWPGILLPFSPSEVNPNLSQEEKHQRLSKRDGETAYLELLKAYLPAIISVAREFYDPRPVKMPLDERIVVGMWGLREAQRRYRPEEHSPDNAVFINLRNEIRLAILAWNGKTAREAAMTTLIEDLADEDSDLPVLEGLKIEQAALEEKVENQLFLGEFFEAVAISYRERHQASVRKATMRIKGFRTGIKRSKLLGRLDEEREQELLERAKSVRAVRSNLGKRERKIERNLVIFYFAFLQRYHYRRNGGGPYPDHRIAKAFGLTRQRIEQIYEEVRGVVLKDPRFKTQLVEMLGWSLEETEQKIY